MNYEREISKFFQGMTEEQRQWKNNPLSVLSGETSFPAVHPVDESQTSVIPIVTGSKAEFYVLPMLSCNGDIDVMFYYSSELALPAGYTPPSHLPWESDNNVKVYEITDSPSPCYVYLRLSYSLTKCSDDRHIRVTNCEQEQRFLNHGVYVSGANVHGPARMYKQLPVYGDSPAYVDSVKCIHCLVWPPQAASWPSRHRKHGWPNRTIIGSVLSQGCDVVAIAHRLCRQDDWESMHQWRLSFSRAEVTLLNSWTPQQQIVYHMLRVFLKNQQLSDSVENALSNYHIKSLMLWACESKSQSWWTGTGNLVVVGVHLLRCLGNWLSDSRCRHYFVDNCNLLGHCLDNEELQTRRTTAAALLSLNVVGLAQWFLDNYVRKCAERCPDNTVLDFDRIQTTVELDNVLSAINRWKERFALYDSARDVEAFFLMVQAFSDGVSSECPGHMACDMSLMWFGKLAEVVRGKMLSKKINLLSLLWPLLSKAEIQLPYGNFYDACFEIVAFALPDSKGTRHSTRLKNFSWSAVMSIFEKKNSETTFGKAADVMKEVSKKTCGPGELPFFELAKAYLYITLKCNDSNSELVYCTANVCTALLYYVTGRYQRALDHCMLTTMSRRTSKRCSSTVIQGEILPKIGDSIDQTLGLAVFYHYVRRVNFSFYSQTMNVGIFTPELFAHYFTIKHLLVANYRTAPKSLDESTGRSTNILLLKELETYKEQILRKERLFTCDILLCKISVDDEFCVTRSSITKSKTSKLSELSDVIKRNSIKRLMSYRYLNKRNFSNVGLHTIGLEALYLYRCSLFERCVKVCQNVVIQEIEEAANGMLRMIPVTYSNFIQLMDTHIVSVLGLILLLDPTTMQTLSVIEISQLCLSLYLMSLCQLRMFHPATSLQYTLDLVDAVHGTVGLCSSRIFDRTLLQMSRRNLIERVARLTGTAKTWQTPYNQRSPAQCTNRCRTQHRTDAYQQLFRSFTSFMKGC